VCQSPSVSRVFSSHHSSVSTRLYPKISELFLLSDFPRAPEACPNSLKIRREKQLGGKRLGKNGSTNGCMFSKDPS
jgi:hypothetical protein